MIENADWVRVGRDEVPTESTRPIFERLAALRDRAHPAWVDRYPDMRDLWPKWQTMGAVGPYGRWHTIDFETWGGFGRDLAPVLQERIRYVVARDQADMVPAPLDPPMLHESSRVLTSAALIRMFNYSPKFANSALDRLKNGERMLRGEGLLNPFHAQTRSAWMRLLSCQGFRVEGSLPGRFTLNRDATPVSAWEVDPGLQSEQSSSLRRTG
jgi:hypothetical protein